MLASSFCCLCSRQATLFLIKVLDEQFQDTKGISQTLDKCNRLGIYYHKITMEITFKENCK